MKLVFVASLLIFSQALHAMEQTEKEKIAEEKKKAEAFKKFTLSHEPYERTQEAVEKVKLESPKLAPGWEKFFQETETVVPEITEALKKRFKAVIDLIKHNDAEALEGLYKDGVMDRLTEADQLFLIHIAAESGKFDSLVALLGIFSKLNPNLNLHNYNRLYPCPKFLKGFREKCTILGLAIAARRNDLIGLLKRFNVDTRNTQDRKLAELMTSIGTIQEQQISENIRDRLYGSESHMEI